MTPADFLRRCADAIAENLYRSFYGGHPVFYVDGRKTLGQTGDRLKGTAV